MKRFKGYHPIPTLSPVELKLERTRLSKWLAKNAGHRISQHVERALAQVNAELQAVGTVEMERQYCMA